MPSFNKVVKIAFVSCNFVVSVFSLIAVLLYGIAAKDAGKEQVTFCTVAFAGGVFVFLASIVGYFAAIKEHRMSLYVYGILTSLILVYDVIMIASYYMLRRPESVQNFEEVDRILQILDWIAIVIETFTLTITGIFIHLLQRTEIIIS